MIMKLEFISLNNHKYIFTSLRIKGGASMQAQEYKIVVNRVFSDNRKTLEETYIEYMAGKIAEVIKEINREADAENLSVSEFAY